MVASRSRREAKGARNGLWAELVASWGGSVQTPVRLGWTGGTLDAVVTDVGVAADDPYQARATSPLVPPAPRPSPRAG